MQPPATPHAASQQQQPMLLSHDELKLKSGLQLVLSVLHTKIPKPFDHLTAALDAQLAPFTWEDERGNLCGTLEYLLDVGWKWWWDPIERDMPSNAPLFREESGGYVKGDKAELHVYAVFRLMEQGYTFLGPPLQGVDLVGAVTALAKDLASDEFQQGWGCTKEDEVCAALYRAWSQGSSTVTVGADEFRTAVDKLERALQAHCRSCASEQQQRSYADVLTRTC